MENFGDQNIYDIEHIGSYGQFSSGNSFPIEYIMASLSMSDIEDLSFARDIKPEMLDFDLLMQRDIDEERVRKDIEPYLNPNLTDEEIRSKVIFFPPLLVAIVPTKEKSMQEYYPDEIGKIKDSMLVREWKNIFKLTYFSSNESNDPTVRTITSSCELLESSVKIAPVKIETRSTKGNREGASLIVIDGQHRLFALREVYAKRPDLIGDLIVPVCILFAPNSTEYREKEVDNGSVPTVPEVFRHLFVDVNTTMELVGGHFNILLSDDSIGSLACRGLCGLILKKEKKKGLAVIEWNTKSKKDSTIVKRPRSLTSIGVIEQGLNEIFMRGRNTQINRMKYILHLNEIEDTLYSLDEEADEPVKVEWDRFSLRQKKLLEKQVTKYLIPALYTIFYTTSCFAHSFSIFKEEIDKVIKTSEGDSDDTLEAIAVIDEVLDYIPIKSSKNNTASMLLLKSLDKIIEDRRKKETPEIIKYAVFQRSIFQAWGKLIDIGREIKYGVNINNVTTALTTLLNHSLENNGFTFHSTRPYMQNSIFDVTKIKATNITNIALSWLILSHLGKRTFAEKICSIMDTNKKQKEYITEELIDLGRASAESFMNHYAKTRKIAFIKQYPHDYATLSSDEIEELQELENRQQFQLQQVKDAKLNRNEVELVFDKKVNLYVQEDVTRAISELKDTLGYDADIVLDNALLEEGVSD